MASEAEIQALQRSMEAVKARLDYIEAHLVQVGRTVGTPYAPSNAEVPPEVIELAKAGKRLDAMTKYRQLTNASADQARDVIAGI